MDWREKKQVPEDTNIKGHLLFKGMQVLVIPDAPSEILQIRKALKLVTTRLQTAGVQYKCTPTALEALL